MGWSMKHNSRGPCIGSPNAGDDHFDLIVKTCCSRDLKQMQGNAISKELLNDTYKHIAEQYEMKGNLKKAEHYYVEASCQVLSCSEAPALLCSS